MNLLKFNFLLLLSLFTGNQLFSQNIASLEEKNQNLEIELSNKNNEIKSLNARLSKCEEEVKYLKEALVLVNSKIQSENQDVNFKINSVDGNSDQGTIKIKGLLENMGAVSNFQVIDIKLVDPKGNEYTTSNVKLGSSKSMIIDFAKNVPLNFDFTFESINEEFPIIKSMIVNFYNRKGFTDKNPHIIFKNLDVVWE